MTSKGSTQGRFQRACDRRNVQQAELAALELVQPLSLLNALALVRLYAETGSPKFDSAAVRWVGRYAFEERDVQVQDMQLAVAALGSLRGRRAEQVEPVLLKLL